MPPSDAEAWEEDDDWLDPVQPQATPQQVLPPPPPPRIGEICARDLTHLDLLGKARVVYVLAGAGIRHETIQKILGCSESTLYRNFREELAQGKELANAAVAFSLFETAVYEKDARSRTVAGIFWMKARAGWKETQVIEQPGSGRVIDTSVLTSEELAEAERILGKAIIDRSDNVVPIRKGAA